MRLPALLAVGNAGWLMVVVLAVGMRGWTTFPHLASCHGHLVGRLLVCLVVAA